MFYEISRDIFGKFPDAIVGVIAARGLDNKRAVPAIQRMLEDKDVTSVNPIVDLGKAVSLKYNMPVGAHDIYSFVRPDGSGRGAEDTGLEIRALSQTEAEALEGLVASGIITEDTTGVIFRIVDFAGDKRDSVEKAMKDFVELIANYYVRSGHSVSVETGIVDKNNRRFEF